MDISPECILCTVKKMDHLYDELVGDHFAKLEFMKGIYSIAAETKAQDTAPCLSAKMLRLFLCEAELSDPYHDQKIKYNGLLMEKEAGIKSKVRESGNHLSAALKYAMVGNLIDFGAMNEVSDGELEKLLASASDLELAEDVLTEFFSQLETARRLVYIGDNAGEIVLDKIFVEILKEEYPELDITFLVRGKPVFNDATMDDAAQIGLTDVIKVLGNGTDIPGTQLNQISEEALELLDSSDLILAKGQGNFESLAGCGRNVFYLFLCKCDLFTNRFKMNKFEGVFVHESKLEI